MKHVPYNILTRCFSLTNTVVPKVCVVGSGPAGFYATQHILKTVPNAQVDIYEKWPVPFGLVRFGVAPDHPEVKNVINTFTKTASSPNVKFIGNVSLGKDVSLKDLRTAYHVVLLTYGAHESKNLNIPGENFRNVISARNIVGWYNGVPSDVELDINLTGSHTVIFGQGNVAIDVARILLTPVDLLKKTDITQYALDKLSASKIKVVSLIGRRGPLQAAYTIKELREMLKLQGCQTVWRPEDFTNVENIVPNLPRPRKRLTELMLKSLTEESPKSDHVFSPVFFRSPLEILGDFEVNGVRLGVNELTNMDLTAQSMPTDRTEDIDCSLVVKSVGYKSVKIDEDIPFDDNSGVARNVNFRIAEGLYTTGWLATGPTGVILTTMGNAFATAEVIAKDLSMKSLNFKAGYEDLKKVLEKKNIQVVSWDGWKKIDVEEQARGRKWGKPREKIVDVEEMLKIAA